MRNIYGDIISMRVRSCGLSFIIMAELIGLRVLIKEVKRLGFIIVVIGGDNKMCY